MRKALIATLILVTALVAGCTGGGGDAGTGGNGAADAAQTETGQEPGQPQETIESYWNRVDFGRYDSAEQMALGDELFDDQVYGSGEVDTTSYDAFGEKGDKLTIDSISYTNVFRAGEGNEQIAKWNATDGYLVNYEIDGSVEKSGARGPYTERLNGTSVVSLVVKKDGEWKIVP